MWVSYIPLSLHHLTPILELGTFRGRWSLWDRHFSRTAAWHWSKAGWGWGWGCQEEGRGRHTHTHTHTHTPLVFSMDYFLCI